MINNTLFFAMLSIFAINGIYAQNKSTASVNQQLKWLYSQQQKNALLQMSIAFDEDFKREKANAEKIAKEKGWEIIIENDSVYMELMRISKYGTPIYYTIHNRTAAKSTRANTLHNGGLLSLNLEGQGMTAYVWDAGIARETHQEYDGVGGNNRFSVGDYATELQDHSAHVMGTIIASGVTASAKGMAPQAYGIGNNWSNDLSEMSSAAANGMLISNHSYGVEIAGNPAKNFGKYSSSARSYDQILYNAPGWLMVLSAGNDGTRNSYNTAPLGGDNNYDKLIDHPVVKNNLVVANGTDAGIDDDGNLTFALIHTSSSQGPTDDYRIKPDITGNGADLYSTISTADDAYTYKNGTSMAAPSVTGTLLLLQQHYNNENSAFMKAATLKGLALHTADDISYSGYSGQLDIIAGPDPISGWGYINGMKAAQTITGEGSISVIEERSLNNSESYTFDVYASGTEDLIASISWTDPPGIVNNAVVNDATPALVNDLDIRVTRGGSTYFPYKLTGVNTNTQADNTVDPFERVDVSTPVTGALYTITVTHKGTLSSSQNYSVIVTGITPSGGGSELPIVFTDAPSIITINSATVGGNVTDNGGHTVTERGIVWGTLINPTTSDNKLQIGTGIGTFSSILSGLTENTTYHIRAYAINSEGASYGSDKQFITLVNNTSTPTVTTATVNGLTQTSADVGGNVTDQGGNTVTERGVVWGLTLNPTTSGNKLQIGTGLGNFNSSLTGLTSSATYHIRAYAINSYGPSYGSDNQFTTLSAPVQPVADFSGIPLIINENQDVIFTDLSINSPTSWLWTVTPNTGVTTIGGTDLNSQNPQVKFANAGNYTITLVSSNTAGDSDPLSKIDYITVNAGVQDYCVSTYTVAGDAQIENVTFNTINNDSERALIDGYEDFTSISTIVNINSTYTLSITASTTFATDYIEAYFDWNADGDWTDAGEMVSVGTLTNTTSGIVTTEVTVPSGASLSSIKMRINTEFNNAPGPCDTDHSTEYGETEDYTINISNSSIIAPVAVFTGTPLTICEGSSVTFTDASTNTPTSWTWSTTPSLGVTTIGGTTQNPQLQFANPGTYTIALIATNAGGSGTETKTDYITVNAEADAGTNGALTVCAGTTPTNAQLFAELGGSPKTGGNWTNSGLVYTYTVTGNSPCTASATATVTVAETPLPTVGFTIDNSEEPVINFTNTTIGADSYSWDLGDGTTLTTTDVSHEYTSDNTFTVVLSATNNCGTENSQQDVVINITNITSFVNENIKVFPNPTENVLHITLPVENVQIQLININGEILKTVESKSNKHITINIEDFAKGIYQLVITTVKHEQITLKVVKM